jgi:hypothetical protein
MVIDYISKTGLARAFNSVILYQYIINHTNLKYNLEPWSPDGPDGTLTVIQDYEIPESIGDFLQLICVLADSVHTFYDDGYMELLAQNNKVLMIITVEEEGGLVDIVIMKNSMGNTMMLEPVIN